MPRYLSETKDYGIKYVSVDFGPSCLVYLDFDGDFEDLRPMSEYLVELGNAVCSLGFTKQPAVALSACEAWYNAVTHAARNILWLQEFLKKRDVLIAIKLFLDTAISRQSDGRFQKSRHRHDQNTVMYKYIFSRSW